MSDDQTPQTPDFSPHPTGGDATYGGSYEGMPYAALRRYVSETSDGGERRRVEAWAAASSERRGYLAALARQWSPDNAGTDAAWSALHPQLDIPAESTPPFAAPWDTSAVAIDVRRQRPARLLTGAFESRRRWAIAPIAAAAALAILATGALVWHERSTPIATRPGPMREVATAAGQRAEVRLGDGSTVTLGVQSRLRFPADFGTDRRELELEGEGYFTVVHDGARPFIVRANGSRTVDIGTAFTLRAYPADSQVRVVVTEGSVSLGHDRAGAPTPAVLTAGHMGLLTRGSTSASVRPVDLAAYLGWLKGRLVFDNTPLTDVATELERWYDVEIRLADPSLARETFTASFTADSFAETLRTLTTVVGLRVERSGRTVVLHRRAR